MSTQNQVSKSSKSISLQSWLLLFLISAIWGSSFILMKKGLLVFPPSQVAALRIFITLLAMLPLMPRYLPKFEKAKLLPVLGVALAGSGIPPFLFTIAQTQIDSAAAGILNTLTPLFTLLLGVLLFNMKLTWQKVLGVSIGMIGAVNLIFQKPTSGDTTNYFYGLFVILAAFLYGSSVNLIKNYCQDIHPITLNAVAFLLIGPFAGIYLFSTSFIQILFNQPGAYQAFAYILVLAIICTAFANILFFKLAQQTNALFASTVTYIIPIVALVWGFIDGEMISWTYLFGMILILGGVYLSSKS